MERHKPHEQPSEPNSSDLQDVIWAQYRSRIRPDHQEDAEALYDEEPEAFLVYLDFYYRNENPDDIRADFTSIYAGSYPDRMAWVHDIIEVLGWDAALRRTLQDASIPPEMLAWQPKALLDFADSMGFTAHESGGQVHIFHE